MGGTPSWVVWLEIGYERTSAPSDHEQILWEPECLMLQLELGTRPICPGLHLSLWLTFTLGGLGRSRKGAGGWDALPSGLHVKFQQKAVPHKCLHFWFSLGVWGLSEVPFETLKPWELSWGGEEDARIPCWTLGRWAPQPTAWGLLQETDVAQLGMQIPSQPRPLLPGHELGKIYLSIPRTGETSANPTRWKRVRVFGWQFPFFPCLIRTWQHLLRLCLHLINWKTWVLWWWWNSSTGSDW